MAAYRSSLTEVKHAEFTRILKTTEFIVLDSTNGKSPYVATKYSNWQIKWVVGVAHLPVVVMD